MRHATVHDAWDSRMHNAWNCAAASLCIAAAPAGVDEFCPRILPVTDSLVSLRPLATQVELGANCKPTA